MWIDLIDFYVGPALLEFDLGMSEIGGDHLDGAVVAETEKDTGGEQYLGLTVCGGDHLAGLQRGVAYRLGGQRTAFYRGLPFDVIESARTGWVRVLPKGCRAQSRQRKNER